MRKKFYYLFTLVYLSIQMNVSAQDGYILIVGSSTDDQSVVDILTEESYTVVRGLDYSGELTSEKLDSVNNADLVIFSRNGATIGHGEAEPVMQQWADVEAPIISLSPWIMRNNRWRWINSTTLDCHLSDSITIPADVQNHVIFNGVDVSSGFLEVLQPGTTRNEKFLVEDANNPSLTVGNGTILAQDPVDNGIIAAEWNEGDYFYNGGDTLAPLAGSDRMWLGFVVEGDNCIEDGNIMSAFNGNDDAKTIFLNAVAYMIGIEPSAVSSVKKSPLSVFPNPATDLLNIRGLNSPVNYQIIDITGSIVLNGFTNNSIDISALSKGMYILKTDNNIYAKFVIQ